MQRRSFLVRIAGVFSVIPFVDRLPMVRETNAENTLVWTTAKGERIRICDLTDDHLRNIIFYMNKVYGYYHPEGMMGGSPADAPPYAPYYDIMRREANRRRLSWI